MIMIYQNDARTCTSIRTVSLAWTIGFAFSYWSIALWYAFITFTILNALEEDFSQGQTVEYYNQASAERVVLNDLVPGRSQLFSMSKDQDRGSLEEAWW